MTGKRKNYLIQGFGINDLDYPVTNCPFYKKWSGLLRRCYATEYLKKKPSYETAYCSEEWKYASTFKQWMETQEWQDKHLDKDLLVPGNKIYAPEFCIFVSPLVNSFLTDRAGARGDYPLGVHKFRDKFAASCQQLGNKRKFLGYFDDPDEAHLAWKLEKHKVACVLAEMQTDGRIAQALKTRFV